MKECWINVYEYPLTKRQWLGNAHANRWQADIITKYRIYVLHVRLK